jgi:methyl-accepting chemotaxis protein
MAFASPLASLLLQAVTRPDTIIARTIPERGLLEWTNGILQLIVLLLAVAAMIALILLFTAMRAGIRRLTETADRLAADAKPMLTQANAMVSDARSMVQTVRRDVERLSDGVGAVSDQLLDAAETTAQRVDEVNAVLDVLQDELENTVLTTAAAVRGVRVGAQALAAGLLGARGEGRRRPRTRPSRRPTDAPIEDRTDERIDDPTAPDVDRD